MDNTDSLQNQGQVLPQTDQTPARPVVSSPWQTPTAPSVEDITPAWQTPTIQSVVDITPDPASIESTSPWKTTPVTGTSTIQPQSNPQFSTATTNPTTDSMAPNAPIVINKKGISPVIMGVLAMFFVVGIAGGTLLMSRGVSSDQPISPNAPASEPKAFDPNEEAGITVTATPTPEFDPNGTIDCAEVPDTAQFGNRCVATVTLPNGVVDWAPGAMDSL